MGDAFWAMKPRLLVMLQRRNLPLPHIPLALARLPCSCRVFSRDQLPVGIEQSVVGETPCYSWDKNLMTMDGNVKR